ncbi:MAG: PA domain-containing protein, partial [Limisphaerales bacterium]
ANQALNGFYSGNVAVLTDYTHNGEYWETGVINYSRSADGAVTQNGDFQSNSVPSMPDIGFPGLGSWAAPSGVNPGDNCAMSAVAYVEFPKAGFYQMGVNSDDNFRVTEGESTNPKSMLSVLAPASIAGDLAAMANIGGMDGSSFGGALPVPPIVSQAVVCDPIWPTTTPTNASALAGKIAIMQRDASGGVATHVYNAQVAGAIAVVVGFADGEGDVNQPGVWGGSANVTIPVINMTYKDCTNLIAHATKDATSPVTLQIGDDSSLKLWEANGAGGKGSSDVIFGVKVPQAGVYPLRLVYENGGGDLNCEWFMQDTATGTKTLINAPNSSVKAWISRAVASRPTLSISSQGGVFKITYTGTLQSSPTVGGAFTDVQGATGSPYT